MNSIRLVASGYFWWCPECGIDNYTGKAPRSVVCRRCLAEFQVVDLVHRQVSAIDVQQRLFCAEVEATSR